MIPILSLAAASGAGFFNPERILIIFQENFGPFHYRRSSGSGPYWLTIGNFRRYFFDPLGMILGLITGKPLLPRFPATLGEETRMRARL
jgi:hypothetical protein